MQITGVTWEMNFTLEEEKRKRSKREAYPSIVTTDSFTLPMDLRRRQVSRVGHPRPTMEKNKKGGGVNNR